MRVWLLSSVITTLEWKAWVPRPPTRFGREEERIIPTRVWLKVPGWREERRGGGGGLGLVVRCIFLLVLVNG